MPAKTFLYAFLIVVTAILFSCDLGEDTVLGKFPDLPQNFEAVNSIYDDYNMDIPREHWSQFPILFSSNRNSQGQNFDLVDFLVYYDYNSTSKTFVFDTVFYSYWIYDSIMPEINTNYNEYGPMVLNTNYADYLFFYANDSSGSLDIKYLHFNAVLGLQKKGILIPLRSSFNEAYPTFNQSFTQVIFCSDSTGNYDIYNASLPDGTSLTDWAKSQSVPVKAGISEINSLADDKCPFINGKLMVFTSNRPGGYGGFDLYYSEYKNKAWSEPVNFGPEINSEYDEYRPVTSYAGYYKNDLMIFSSNRTGGKGGYDIYYVGIPKMID